MLIDYDRRFRRRIVLERRLAGAEVLIDLPQAVRLRDGDGLALSDTRRRAGGCARAEELMEIHAHQDAAISIRIAWHLGNRHLPMQLLGESHPHSRQIM